MKIPKLQIFQILEEPTIEHQFNILEALREFEIKLKQTMPTLSAKLRIDYIDRESWRISIDLINTEQKGDQK